LVPRYAGMMPVDGFECSLSPDVKYNSEQV
jgi:hypothetical protein